MGQEYFLNCGRFNSTTVNYHSNFLVLVKGSCEFGEYDSSPQYWKTELNNKILQRGWWGEREGEGEKENIRFYKRRL